MHTERDHAERLNQTIDNMFERGTIVPRSDSNSTQDDDPLMLVHDLRMVAESTPMRADFASELEARLVADPLLDEAPSATSVTENPLAVSHADARSKRWLHQVWPVRDDVQQAKRAKLASERVEVGGGRVSRGLGLAGALVLLLGLVGAVFLLARPLPGMPAMQFPSHATPTIGASATGVDLGGAFKLPPLPQPTGELAHQQFFISMGDGGKGIPAIEPQSAPSITATGAPVPRITNAQVEQYVSTHTMHGSLVTISYEGSEPTIAGIELAQLRDVYRRYMPEALQQPWQEPYPPESLVYMVELEGTFRFSGGPYPGDLGTYHTGVWVFDANTGYDLLEGGVGRIAPGAPATVTEMLSAPVMTIQPTPTRVPGSPPVALVREGAGFRLDVYEGAARLGFSPWFAPSIGSWIDPSRLLVEWYSTPPQPTGPNNVYTYSTYIVDTSNGKLITLPGSEPGRFLVPSPDGKRAVMVWHSAGVKVSLYDFESGALQTVADFDPTVTQWARPEVGLSKFRAGAEVSINVVPLWAGNDSFALTVTVISGLGGDYPHQKVLLVDVRQHQVRALAEQGTVIATWPDGSMLVQMGNTDGAIQLFHAGDNAPTTISSSGTWNARWSISPDGKQVAWLEMTPPVAGGPQSSPADCCSSQYPPALKSIVVFDSATGKLKRFGVSGTAWTSPAKSWTSGDKIRWSKDGSALYYSLHPVEDHTTLYRLSIDGQTPATPLVDMDGLVGLDVVAEGNDGSIYYTVLGEDCQNCAQLMRRYADSRTEMVHANDQSMDWMVSEQGQMETLAPNGVLVTDLSTGQAHHVEFPGEQGSFVADIGWSTIRDLVPISPGARWAAYAGSQSDDVAIGPDGRPDRGRTVRIVPIK